MVCDIFVTDVKTSFYLKHNCLILYRVNKDVSRQVINFIIYSCTIHIDILQFYTSSCTYNDFLRGLNTTQ